MDATPNLINKYVGHNEGMLTPFCRRMLAWTFSRLIPRYYEAAAALSEHEFVVY